MVIAWESRIKDNKHYKNAFISDAHKGHLALTAEAFKQLHRYTLIILMDLAYHSDG